MALVMKETLHMNTGDGETSYANNSGLQRVVISETWQILDETLKAMFAGHHGSFSKCFKMADFGCATGSNTLLVISHVMDAVEQLCNKNNIVEELPEFEVFLNDLPGNDFNSLFKLLPSFYDQEQTTKGRRRCFVSGLPGSFYGRLLPSNSLHFAYSSYSLHWLSQIPEGVRNNNKANISMAPTSPPEIFEAYAQQYQRDFFRFLRCRGEEIVPGGRMVLTFIGRSSENPSSKDEFSVFTLLATTLVDMVSEGLVKEDVLFSFNVPIYHPCQQEVQAIIAKEGSFNLEKMNVFQVPWDANHDDDDDQGPNKYRSGKLVAGCVRAFMEPMLARHFGSSINVDEVFDRYAKKVAEKLSTEISSYFNIAISLRRK